MAMKRFRGRTTWLLAGMAMGLLFGLGTTAGVMWATRSATIAGHPAWPQGAPLHASTACTSESLAIATGVIDEQVEGLYTLDFITGDLQCFVLNPRTGKFVGWFKTNVTTHLPVEKGKKPQYLLTTGNWQPAGFSGNIRPANSVVYVADANTGMFAAYYVPWFKGASSTNITQSQAMQLLDGNKARSISLRAE
jgi:hypothetical protein